MQGSKMRELSLKRLIFNLNDHKNRMGLNTQEVAMARQVVIDDEDCEECESCVQLCPEVFAFDEENQVAEVIKPDADDECIDEAIDSCPTACIRWEED